MADEFHGDTGLGIELFFKGEDAKRFGEAAADQVHAPGTPGPELRANVIDISNAPGTEFARETEMEAGEVRQDGEGRAAARGFVHEMAHGAEQGGKAPEDFGDADNGDFGIVGDDFDAGGAHLRTAHAENGDVQALLERGGEASGVHVSGSFAGGEKERYRWHVWMAQRLVAGRRNGRFGRAAGVEREVQLLLFVLQLVKTVVNATLSQKFLMRALLA